MKIAQIGSMVAVILFTTNCAAISAAGKQNGSATDTKSRQVETKTDVNAREAIAYQGTYFTIVHDSRVVIEKVLKPDFYQYVFRFKNDSRVILNAVDSSYPRFPLRAPEDTKLKVTRVNKLKAETYRWKSESDEFCRETLITIGTDKMGVPVYVHFMYVSISKDDAAAADAIIESVRRGGIRTF